MGIITSLRRKFGINNRAERAAHELAKALMARGTAIEIPSSLSTDDNVTNMILALRELYPNIETSMLQSKSIVVQFKKTTAVTSEAWGLLEKGGYFPGKELSPELFLASHQAFMERNNMTREEAEKYAVEERERNATVTVTES